MSFLGTSNTDVRVQLKEKTLIKGSQSPPKDYRVIYLGGTYFLKNSYMNCAIIKLQNTPYVPIFNLKIYTHTHKYAHIYVCIFHCKTQAKYPGFVCNNLTYSNPMARPRTIADAWRERIEPFQPITQLYNMTMFTLSKGIDPITQLLQLNYPVYLNYLAGRV